MSNIEINQIPTMDMHKVLIYLTLAGLIFFSHHSIAESASATESTSYKHTIQAGKATYDRYCESCHGENAEGNGRYAQNLTSKPSDLTVIAARNNGVFPLTKMYQIIDGTDNFLAHGSREMPIWGERFDLNNWGEGNWERGHTEHSIRIARGRILELLMYLDSIQK